MHELVAHAHAKIFVLIHDRPIRVSIVAAVIALLDQRPGLFLFLGFRLDEFLNIRMPILQCIHLGSTPRLPTTLHHVSNLMMDLEERRWFAGTSSATQFFPGASKSL